MTPDLQRFLDSATRPLERHPEALEEAKAELMGRVSHQGVPLEMIDVSAETAVLESSGARSPWIRRVAMLTGLVLGLAFWVIGLGHESLGLFRLIQAQSLSRYYQWGHSFIGSGERSDLLFGWQERVAPDLPITGNYMIYPEIQDETQVLLRRSPGDLSILQEHLQRRSTAHDEFMTAEIREAVDRLDPDNALWPWLESTWLKAKANGRDPAKMEFYVSSSSRVSADPAMLKRSWELYQEASVKPTFKDHSLGLVRRQIEAFPMDGMFLTHVQAQAYRELVFSAGGSRDSYYYSSDDDLNVFVAGFIHDKDLEGLKQFAESWRRLKRMVAKADVHLPSSGVEVMEREAAHLSDAFGSLNDPDLEKEFDELAKELGMIEVRNYLSSSDPLDDLMPIRGQMANLIPQQIDPQELEPARLGERAFFDRLFGWYALIVLFFLTFCCGFEAYRRHVSVKGMARGISPLFGWKDQVWVGVVGIAAPGLYWFLITRLTPLGFRKYGMDDEWMVLGWLLQATLSLVLMMVMLVQAVHWRWGIRGGFLGFRGRVDWLGWAVAGIVALSIPAVNIVEHLVGSEEEKALFLLSMGGAGLVGVLWLLWVGGMNLFTSRQGALRPNVVSHTLLPWSIALAWLMLASAGVLLFLEKGWSKKDTLFAFDTSETYSNAFEERAVREVEEALLRIFEPE